MAELYVIKISHWWKPTRESHVDSEEIYWEGLITLHLLSKQAQGVTSRIATLAIRLKYLDLLDFELMDDELAMDEFIGLNQLILVISWSL
ncbi:hypothetical protein Tco_0637139 [Tanacetum coccineum]